MFDLSRAIEEWREQMLACGIKNPVPLDELESHLREDVELQLQCGVNGQQAFQAAVRRMGQARVLKSEFKKVERKQMKRHVTILTGLLGILFGFGLIWPQLGMLHRTGAIRSLPALLAGAAIVIAAGSVIFYNIRKQKERRERNLVGVCLIVVGGFCSVVNASTLLELRSTEWFWWPPVIAVTLLFFGRCLYLNRTLPMRLADESL